MLSVKRRGLQNEQEIKLGGLKVSTDCKLDTSRAVRPKQAGYPQRMETREAEGCSGDNAIPRLPTQGGRKLLEFTRRREELQGLRLSEMVGAKGPTKMGGPVWWPNS